MCLGAITPALLDTAKKFLKNKIASFMVKISHPKIKIEDFNELDVHHRIAIQLHGLNENTNAGTGSSSKSLYITDGKKIEFPNS
jgi:hypothetical protein